MTRRTYRVIAEESVVHGHATGEQFTADLEEEGLIEEALLQGGALEIVKRGSQKVEDGEQPEEATEEGEEQ